MHKVVSALAVAFAGVVAASLLTTWRKSQLEAEALEKRRSSMERRWRQCSGACCRNFHSLT